MTKMNRYELEHLFKNQLSIMRYLANMRDFTDPDVEDRIKQTERLIKLIEDQGKAGRQ